MQKRRIFSLVLAVVLLFLLAFGGIITYYFLDNPTTAQVSIRPAVQNLQRASTLTLVTGHPDAAQQQLSGARVLSATLTQTSSQTATGKGYAKTATYASGMMEMVFRGPSWNYVSEYLGTTVTGSDGITVVTDRGATALFNHPAYFPVHVVPAGARGNIPAYAFQYHNTYATYYHADIFNVTPLTGGQDAGPYSFVQQSDISAGEATFTPTVKISTLALLSAQMSANGTWAQAPACATSATTDGTLNERVKNFHVTVTATCSGEVYDAQVVKAAATEQLTSMESSELDAQYQQLGEITTTVTGVQVLDKQKGTLAVTLLAQGRWLYHFTDAQKQHLVQIISGKSIEDAQKLLAQQAHIAHATITTMHTFWLWNTLPTDLKKISLTILPVQ